MSLVTLVEVKDYLGITTAADDAYLQGQIDMFSATIEQYCGRKFLQASYTQTFYAEDFKQDAESSWIYSYHFPVVNITQIDEVSYDAQGNQTSVTLASGEYRVHSESGRLYKTNLSGRRKLWFTGGNNPNEIQVQYDAGYVDTPLPIKDAIYSLIGERYNKKLAGIDQSFGSDVQRVAISGVMSIDFDYTLQANERKTGFGMILGNYVNILDQYRSERPLIGAIKENYVS